jgi:hypothetical protein
MLWLVKDGLLPLKEVTGWRAVIGEVVHNP